MGCPLLPRRLLQGQARNVALPARKPCPWPKTKDDLPTKAAALKCWEVDINKRTLQSFLNRIAARLYNDLLALKDEAEDKSPSGWIVPAGRARRRRAQSGEIVESTGVMPLDYHSWVNRNLRPVATKLDIRVNCQIMRRTFATLAHDVGGDLKDIQAQMPHSRSATTADIYVQPIASRCPAIHRGIWISP